MCFSLISAEAAIRFRSFLFRYKLFPLLEMHKRYRSSYSSEYSPNEKPARTSSRVSIEMVNEDILTAPEHEPILVNISGTPSADSGLLERLKKYDRHLSNGSFRQGCFVNWSKGSEFGRPVFGLITMKHSKSQPSAELFSEALSRICQRFGTKKFISFHIEDCTFHENHGSRKVCTQEAIRNCYNGSKELPDNITFLVHTRDSPECVQRINRPQNSTRDVDKKPQSLPERALQEGEKLFAESKAPDGLCKNNTKQQIVFDILGPVPSGAGRYMESRSYCGNKTDKKSPEECIGSSVGASGTTRRVPIVFSASQDPQPPQKKKKKNDNVSKFQFREITGDLFGSSDSLAHCVSEDFKMGAGIAKTFKSEFGRVNELLHQGRSVGQVAVLLDRKGQRFIYYLVTKEHYYDKPTLRSLEKSLIAMKDHAVRNGVNAISMPAIGCGLDKLDWGKVRAIICNVFETTSIVITIYMLENHNGPKWKPKGPRGTENYDIRDHFRSDPGRGRHKWDARNRNK